MGSNGATLRWHEANDRAEWDAADASWANATITARGAVLYKKLGGAASADPLICYIDFGADKTSTAGTFTIQWSADGILYLN